MELELRTEGGLRVAVLGGERLQTVKEWLVAVDGGALRACQGFADALLLDFRKAGYTPSARDASALVAALLAPCGDRLPPVAILTNAGVQYGSARVLCVMGELRGCRLAAFQEEADAWQWMMKAVATDLPDTGMPGLLLGT